MRKKRKFAAAIIMLMLVFTLMPSMVWATSKYSYNSSDTDAINELCENHGLQAPIYETVNYSCEPVDDWPFVEEWNNDIMGYSMTILNLKKKGLYGEIKDKLASLGSLPRFARLTSLDLSENKLSGKIILNNPELHTLDLSNNQFTHVDLSDMRVLSSLKLSGNPLREVSLPGNRIIRPACEPQDGGMVTRLEQLSIEGAMVLEAKPSPGYKFVKWEYSIDADPSVAASLKIDPAANPVSFTLPQNAEIKMTAVFAPIHSITVTTEGNGTAVPSGTTQVTDGQDAAFTFTPAKGWKVKSVTADGKELGTLPNYTFHNVTQDHVLHVVFEEKQVKSATQTEKKPDKPEPPAQTENKSDKSSPSVQNSSPATGDDFPIYLWLALALLSAAAITAILLGSIRQKTRK